ncbi:thiolase C-terminal domain-containing protein [Amycolatopsis sp. cmx-4-68]|uniref:thiolase C-terminal domain-containing protein n=1 Tax=Amycolatopsis sp. cmx-4-68 TaxID=2790938 RepID=UPI00397CDDC4
MHVQSMEDHSATRVAGLAVKGVGKTFPGGVVALDQASFSVETGQFAALVGPSGCGKSTLLRLLAGITETSAGYVEVAHLSGGVHPDGWLPVNLSGGLKSKGHPVGATGVSQHVLAARQLSGTAGEMQLRGARRAAVHNMGGLAVANYVGVLEAVA